MGRGWWLTGGALLFLVSWWAWVNLTHKLTEPIKSPAPAVVIPPQELKRQTQIDVATSAAAPAPSARTQTAVPVLADKARSWDLCGIGQVPIPAELAASAGDGAAALPAHLGSDAKVAARAALLQAMQRGDLRAQAVATLMSSPASPSSAGLQAQQDTLLALAERGRDPAIALWALEACVEDKACSLRAARAWQRVDPDNAAPWAVLLDLDPLQREQIEQAILRASHFRTYQGVLPGLVLAAMPSNTLPYLQQALLADAMAMEGVRGQRAASGLRQLCRAAPAAAEADHVACDAIARMLMAQSDSLLGDRLGLRFAEQAGWPKAELNPRFELSNEMLNVGPRIEASAPASSCAAFESTRSWVQSLAKRGDLEARRERAAALSASKSAAPAQRGN
jgi:hypothetical protein